jgi:hypothetical protein
MNCMGYPPKLKAGFTSGVFSEKFGAGALRE